MRHLGLAFLLLLTASAPAQDIQVDVQGSGGRLYQVAVQRFAAMDGAFPLREAFFRDLSEAIAFSSVLEPVDHSAFLGPSDTRDLASGIQCGNWKGIGADALVQGQLRTVGLELVARYRVWDTVRCKLQGKVIEARRPREDAQLLARSIADEIVERFTGRRGVSATARLNCSPSQGSFPSTSKSATPPNQCEPGVFITGGYCAAIANCPESRFAKDPL